MPSWPYSLPFGMDRSLLRRTQVRTSSRTPIRRQAMTNPTRPLVRRNVLAQPAPKIQRERRETVDTVRLRLALPGGVLCLLGLILCLSGHHTDKPRRLYRQILSHADVDDLLLLRQTSKSLYRLEERVQRERRETVDTVRLRLALPGGVLCLLGLIPNCRCLGPTNHHTDKPRRLYRQILSHADVDDLLLTPFGFASLFLAGFYAFLALFFAFRDGS
jgi:hypothetical protein